MTDRYVRAIDECTTDTTDLCTRYDGEDWPERRCPTHGPLHPSGGLFLGPVEDGVQTYYGLFEHVPEGMEYSIRPGQPWLVKKAATTGIDRDRIVQARRKAQPKTERVPWHEAAGRVTVTPSGEHALIVKVEKNRNFLSPWIWTDPAGPGNGGGIGFPSRDGTVEVLREDET